MRKNEIAMERCRVRRIDSNRGKFPEAGVDAVNGLAAGGDGRYSRCPVLDLRVKTTIKNGILCVLINCRELCQRYCLGV